MNYYNEFDPKAAAWLRQLISEKQIPNGHVDTRSILEVQPSDLSGFTQCHFFAGIGGWSLALRYAGWPEDRPVWTGSCPCQPFSAAGKGLGTADERHLWPVFAELIRQCQPPTVFGEQVASKAGRSWLSGVFADLEGMGYRRAGADLCAAGVGKDHIRQRLFWLADADSERRSWIDPLLRQETRGRDEGHIPEVAGYGETDRMADADHRDESGNTGSGDERTGPRSEPFGRGLQQADSDVSFGRLEYPMRRGREMEMQQNGDSGEPSGERQAAFIGDAGPPTQAILCRDGKTRRIERTILRMVDGIPCGMVPCGYSRPRKLQTEREEVDAEKSSTNGNQGMRDVRTVDPKEEIRQRSDRRSKDIHEENVLRSGLHGFMDDREDQGSESQELPEAIMQGGEAGMRGVWQTGQEVACPSQGFQPDEQYFGKFSDFVQLMPQAMPLAKLRGDSATEEALQTLRETCDEKGIMLHPLDAAQEAWGRYPRETRKWFWKQVSSLGLNYGSVSPLATKDSLESIARSMRLKGYGNAIVPELAAEFIMSYMEVTTP